MEEQGEEDDEEERQNEEQAEEKVQERHKDACERIWLELSFASSCRPVMSFAGLSGPAWFDRVCGHWRYCVRRQGGGKFKPCSAPGCGRRNEDGRTFKHDGQYLCPMHWLLLQGDEACLCEPCTSYLAAATVTPHAAAAAAAGAASAVAATATAAAASAAAAQRQQHAAAVAASTAAAAAALAAGRWDPAIGLAVWESTIDPASGDLYYFNRATGMSQWGPTPTPQAAPTPKAAPTPQAASTPQAAPTQQAAPTPQAAPTRMPFHGELRSVDNTFECYCCRICGWRTRKYVEKFGLPPPCSSEG